METKSDYYQTSPEFVKLKLGPDEPEKPVALARSELIKMIIFLFLGLGCLLATAYVYTQSKTTAKEAHQVILQNRTEAIQPVMTEPEAEPLFFKPYHVMVIRIHSPFLQFHNVISQLGPVGYEMDDEEVFGSPAEDTTDGITTESSTTSTPFRSSSSDTSSSWDISSTPNPPTYSWLQEQFSWVQGQMSWFDRNLGLGWFSNYGASNE